MMGKTTLMPTFQISATVTIDTFEDLLNEHEFLWATLGHRHAIFPNTYTESLRITGATPMVVGQ